MSSNIRVTLVAASALATLLAACQTSPLAYVPPNGDNTAKLLLRPVTPKTAKFGVFSYTDAYACRNPQRVLVGDSATANQSTALNAGPLATLSFVAAYQHRSCRVVFSFYPKAHHLYLLSMSQDGITCSVRLFDATDHDNPRPEPSVSLRTVRASGCEPLNQNLRSNEMIGGTFDNSNINNTPDKPNTLSDFKDLLPN